MSMFFNNLRRNVRGVALARAGRRVLLSGAVLPLGVGIGLPCLGAASPARLTTAAATQAERLSPESQRRFQDFVDLLKEQNTPKARRTGARELLNRGWPQAIEVLLEVLQNERDPIAQMAVIDVLAEADQPNPRFIQPLIALLGSKDEKMRDATADALARYGDGGVVDQLSRLARGADQPVADLAMRIAAIRALSQMSDRAQAMEVLVGLLKDPSPEVRVRAAQAISDAAGIDFAEDFGAIEKWWQLDKARTDLSRARDRHQVKIKQNRALQKRLEAVQTILVATLRKLYLRMPDAQKTDTLLEYLEDPTAEVRVLGVELINAMLTDRKPVPDPVLKRLRLMIPDTNARVRRQVVLTLRDMHDVADAKLILGQYRLETDGTVRAAMLNALGRLGDPDAIGLMIEAVSSEDKQIIAEGALGLAVLGEEGHVPAEKIAPAIKPLKDCYGKLAAADQQLREQLLEAMARIADPQFAPIFVDGLASENVAAVRQAAARGIAALGKPENARLLIDHLSDQDTGVRRTVVDALARIAKSDHLEALFSRLDAKIESDAAVRDKAWDGIRQVLRGLQVNEQRAWIAARLDPKTDKATAERYVELMTDIEKDLAAATPQPSDLLEVRERLADGLSYAGQFAEAARVYKLAHDALIKAQSGEAWGVGLKLFVAQLQADRYDEALSLAGELRESGNGKQRDQLSAALHTHLDGLLKASEPDKALDVLKRIGPRHGDAWTKKFGRLRQQAEDLRREQDVATVRKCLAQLRGDADEVERAQQQIRTLGTRAIGPLVEELRALLTAAEGDPAREAQILKLLRALAPNWEGYPERASTNTKLRALDRLSRTASPARRP